MTVNKAIVLADGLRMNTVSDEQKALWLFTLDSDIADMMEQEVKNTFPHDRELLLPESDCDVYVKYLVAMIDYFNREVELYQNDLTLFNEAFDKACARYRRNNRPQKKYKWEV